MIVNIGIEIQCETAAEAMNVNLEDKVEFAEVCQCHECFKILRMSSCKNVVKALNEKSNSFYRVSFNRSYE